jgi:hypothetical protein
VAGIVAVVASVSHGAAAQQPKYSPGLWESFVVIERFASSDGKPSKRDIRKDNICVVPGDDKAMQPMFSPEIASRLKGKCWQSDSREEPGKKQVKMACENGTTAESVVRLETDGSIGSMIVLNVPGQGGLKLQGRSRKVADTCPAQIQGKADESKDAAPPAVPAPKVETPPPRNK